MAIPPRPIAENDDVWAAYRLGYTQWNLGFAGRVSLNLPAIIQIASTVGVALDEVDIRKLNLISGLIVAEDAERQKNKG